MIFSGFTVCQWPCDQRMTLTRLRHGPGLTADVGWVFGRWSQASQIGCIHLELVDGSLRQALSLSSRVTMVTNMPIVIITNKMTKVTFQIHPSPSRYFNYCLNMLFLLQVIGVLRHMPNLGIWDDHGGVAKVSGGLTRQFDSKEFNATFSGLLSSFRMSVKKTKLHL